MTEHLLERRRSPRAALDYRGVLQTSTEGVVKLRARNISASGVYFDAEKKLPEFTEVSLEVHLPAVGKVKALSFRCAGVIVRVDYDDRRDDLPYSAAVHFTDIDDAHRAAISAYVDAILERA